MSILTLIDIYIFKANFCLILVLHWLINILILIRKLSTESQVSKKNIKQVAINYEALNMVELKKLRQCTLDLGFKIPKKAKT